MWARIVEMMTAVWIALSPFIFRDHGGQDVLWPDQLFALAIVILAGLSYWRPTRYAHVLILVIAVGLVIWGRIATGTPPTPAHQNHIVVGLFLLMVAIVPNEASLPPKVWREIP